jgi:hypothetical protein
MIAPHFDEQVAERELPVERLDAQPVPAAVARIGPAVPGANARGGAEDRQQSHAMRRLEREIPAVDVTTPEPIVDERIRDGVDPAQLVRRHDTRRAIRPRPIGGCTLEEPRPGATVATIFRAQDVEDGLHARDSTCVRRSRVYGEQRIRRFRLQSGQVPLGFGGDARDFAPRVRPLPHVNRVDQPFGDEALDVPVRQVLNGDVCRRLTGCRARPGRRK